MLTIMQPLLKLRALQTAELAGFIRMPYSDEDVFEIATAWPKIECMVLPPPCEEVQRPSLTSLKFLTRFCPRLELLSMSLNVNRADSFDPGQEQWRHLEAVVLAGPHPLVELNLCESDLKEIDEEKFAERLRS